MGNRGIQQHTVSPQLKSLTYITGCSHTRINNDWILRIALF